MFCNQCGSPLQQGQQACGRCGAPVLGMVTYRRNRVLEHVRLLGVLWMAYSAFAVIAGIVLAIVAQTVFGRSLYFPGAPPAPSTLWLRPFLSFISALILVKGSAGFIAGWGLLQREPWGRLLALVLGFISLFNIPLGTALGIYTLWVLLPAQSDEEYRAFAAAA